jgi:hypothetical protein
MEEEVLLSASDSGINFFLFFRRGVEGESGEIGEGRKRGNGWG